MSPVHLSLQKKEGFHRMIEKLLGGKFPFLKIFSHIYWQQNITFKKNLFDQKVVTKEDIFLKLLLAKLVGDLICGRSYL